MKKLVIIPVVAILAFSVAAFAATDDAPKPDNKVWICHFAGHTADAPIAHGSGHTSDADYALNPTAVVDGVPSAGAYDKCENLYGGNLIEVAKVAAEKGHKAIRLEWWN